MKSVWLSESGTFYRSFQFPLHGNYQLVFSRLPTTKNLLKRKIFKQRRFFRTFKYKRMNWYRDFSQITRLKKDKSKRINYKENVSQSKVTDLREWCQPDDVEISPLDVEDMSMRRKRVINSSYNWRKKENMLDPRFIGQSLHTWPTLSPLYKNKKVFL